MVSHKLENEAYPASQSQQQQSRSTPWLPSLKKLMTLTNDGSSSSNSSNNGSTKGYEKLSQDEETAAAAADDLEVPIVIIEEVANEDDNAVNDTTILLNTTELAKPINGIRRKRSINYGQPDNFLNFGHGNNLTYGTMNNNSHIHNHNNIHATMNSNFLSTSAAASMPRQRKISRAITKKGASNLTPANIGDGRWPYMADIFTTVLDMDWPNIIIVFCFSYFASWLLFATAWWSIAFFHGDLDPINRNKTNWEPCITELKSFTSAFLFSVETQHTTGYGYFHLTERCPSAVITLCAQSILGCILEGIMVGLLFVKISRAKKRSLTLMFSRNAVISLRDNELCFMFRIADMRKSHLLSASVRASVISKRKTAEGEEITISQEELDVGGDGEKSNNLFLFWPTTIIHRINSSSPLYKISATDLNPENTNFEIIVVLEGIVEATGLTTQAKSSYMPHEILWGHRFRNVTSMKSKTGERVVDYSLFHETVYFPTSPLSAQQLDSLSFTPSVTKEEIVKLATSVVKTSIQESFKHLRSYK